MSILEVAADPLAFETWIQVTALGILVAGGLLALYLKGMSTRAKDTGETVQKVLKTLTTNNGGSHIKDQLDRLEQTHQEHLAWSREFAAEQKAMHEALDKNIECQQAKLDKVWKTVSPDTPE